MSYLYPQKSGEAKIEIKGSRFIGRLVCAENISEAEGKLLEIKNEFRDATHNCWAYRLHTGDGKFEFRYNDEGEPSGTAGKPIFDSMEEKNIGDALLVVTRYFGGTKLGMGGLSRAYRQCARETISNAILSEKIELTEFELRFPYIYEPVMRSHLHRSDGNLEFSRYEDSVTWKVNIPKIAAAVFIELAKDICRGDLEIIEGERKE